MTGQRKGDDWLIDCSMQIVIRQIESEMFVLSCVEKRFLRSVVSDEFCVSPVWEKNIYFKYHGIGQKKVRLSQKVQHGDISLV